jgi:hypothetical protein
MNIDLEDVYNARNELDIKAVYNHLKYLHKGLIFVTITQ